MVLVLYFFTCLHVWLFCLLNYVFSFYYFHHEFIAGPLVAFLVLSFLQWLVFWERGWDKQLSYLLQLQEDQTSQS